MGREMACQPVQASSSCLGSRLSASVLLELVPESLQVSGPPGQYLPLPYMPSMPVTMRVSSSLSLGSDGVAMVSESLRSLSLRAVTGSSAEAVEARGLLGVIHGGGDGAFVDLGGQGFGVVGDVGGLDPIGAAGLDAQRQQLLLGVVDELAGLLGGGFAPGATGQSDERDNQTREEAVPHDLTIPEHPLVGGRSRGALCALPRRGHCAPCAPPHTISVRQPEIFKGAVMSAHRVFAVVFASVLIALAFLIPATAQNPAGKPASEPYTWKSVQIVGGGFVDGIIFHPTAKGVRYARTDMGGAYRWNAQTKRWEPLLDWVAYEDSNLMGVESIALDPADPNRVYLACGTYTNAHPDGAILRSSDRGKTFERTNVPFKFGGNEDGRGNGERMTVDPERWQRPVPRHAPGRPVEKHGRRGDVEQGG